MEDQRVTISRVRYTNTYPASFMLVAAMNPCSCGYFGTDRCKCTDYEVMKYRQKNFRADYGTDGHPEICAAG